MAKKLYESPILGLGLGEDEDPNINFGVSQGTSGEDPRFNWDPEIDPNDIDMFWNTYDETDLEIIDTDDDFFISKAEFDAWYASEQPW